MDDTFTITDLALARIKEDLIEEGNHDEAAICGALWQTKIEQARQFIEESELNTCPQCLFETACMALTTITIHDDSSTAERLQQSYLVAAFLICEAKAKHEKRKQNGNNQTCHSPAGTVH